MPKYCKPDKNLVCKYCNKPDRKYDDLCGTLDQKPVVKKNKKPKTTKKSVVDHKFTLLEKAKRYLAERKRWANEDKPVRSPEEMERIFNICRECPLFNKSTEVSGTCNECGCSLHKSRLTLNKIAWATTSCPLEEPKWVAEIEEGDTD
jgi:hypothetical protein